MIPSIGKVLRRSDVAYLQNRNYIRNTLSIAMNKLLAVVIKSNYETKG